MNNKPKLVYGIKGKLISAACMLLVAVIMVVSSTYAWFTLSTAPEITGINTAVGANGSLEMALLPESGVAGQISSGTGDAAKLWTEKNITWGNLVDLSSGYGLDKISLYPSKLNAEGNILSGNMLQVPVYGSDGRVDKLAADKTVTGVFSSETDGFPVTSGNGGFGVRAVGVASGMTGRQLDYRNASAKATTYIGQAKDAAASSLNANGSSLANIVAKKATGQDSYTQEDITALQNLVSSLNAPLDYIEKAYLQYILGYAASSQFNDDTAWTGVKGLVNAEGATLSSVLASLSTHGVNLDGTDMKAPIDALLATKASVAEAKNKLDALTGKDSYTWNEISEAVYKLANVDNMTINGFTAAEIKGDENGNKMSELVNAVASEGAIVSMTSGGGVYADIADHCGSYTASVKIDEIAYSGLVLTNLSAKMHAKTDLNPAYLTLAGTALSAAGAPSGGNNTLPISEFYGYVIDMAFRTNAAESSLLLQTAPVDRIYSDNTDNVLTQGHGSTMTFASTTNDFTNDQVKELMKAIRVVFFVPGATVNDSSKIVAYAQLDIENATIGADGVTANLYLTDASGSMIKEQENAKIMDLVQNAPTKLSVLVYLDGEGITNADVAAKAQNSMTGKMNLQFSSSATLVPMEYADFQNK